MLNLLSILRRAKETTIFQTYTVKAIERQVTLLPSLNMNFLSKQVYGPNSKVWVRKVIKLKMS